MSEARAFAPGPAEARPEAPDGTRWVSCAKDLSWDAARYSHLLTGTSLDTWCGHSASFPGVWRASSTKPPCPNCLAELPRKGHR